jgi:hypothetical protein
MPLFDFGLCLLVNDARIAKQSIMDMFYRNVILASLLDMECIRIR